MTKSLRARPIIERADDLLVNGSLRTGRKDIRGWDVCFYQAAVKALRTSPAGTTIDPTGGGHIEISQSIRAWPNVRYRLDVHVEPLGRSTRRAPADNLPVAHDGSSGSIQVRFTSLRKGEEIRAYEPPTMRIGADTPPIHRAIVQCPPGTGRLQVRLRFQASQPLAVKRIRLVETGDYLMTSHVLANPPLPSREPPPCVPDSVLLCDGRKDNRPLLRWLQGVFGETHVQRVAPTDLVRLLQNTPKQAALGGGTRSSAPLRGDQPHSHSRASMPVAHRQPWAPGMAPGHSSSGGRHGPATAQDRGTREKYDHGQHGRGTRRSDSGGTPAIVIDLPEGRSPQLQDLLAWSDRAIVIVSLETFAGAASRAGIKDLRLQDRVSGLDMPCGEITQAGYFTRGFALGDAIPYAWNDGQDDFAHRYLAMPKPTKAQLAKMGVLPAIVTECGQREYYNHPLVLHRPGRRGALLVMDPDGLEQPSAGDGVPRIFDLLWRDALGQPTVDLGQFSAPPTHYEGMLVDLAEVAKHYDLIEDVSVLTRVRGQGNWPPTWLLPSRRNDRFADRPALYIRTGFAESDWPAVYALLLWLKRLALAAARNEADGRDLLQRLRVLAWPIAQPQAWRGCPKDVAAPRREAGDALLGEIDLQVGQEPRAVILVPDRNTETMVRQALRPASRSIAPGATGSLPASVWASQPLSGRDVADVRIAPDGFETHGSAARSRHLRCKVLLPGVPQTFPTDSPWLTDLAARLLQGLATVVARRAPGR